MTAATATHSTRRRFLQLTVIGIGAGVVQLTGGWKAVAGLFGSTAANVAADAAGVEGIAVKFAVDLGMTAAVDAAAWLAKLGVKELVSGSGSYSPVANGQMHPAGFTGAIGGVADSAPTDLLQQRVFYRTANGAVIDLLPRAAQAMSRVTQAITDGTTKLDTLNAEGVATHLLPIAAGVSSGGLAHEDQRSVKWLTSAGWLRITHDAAASGKPENETVEVSGVGTWTFPIAGDGLLA